MKIRSKSVFHFFVFLALLANSLTTYTPVYAASTLYVKETPTGSGDCSSWSNACALQTALTNSASGDQIWVMAGTYKPTGPDGDRTISFVIKSGVAVYGGYTGTGTQRDIDPATNGTILSGDLNGNDSNFTNNGENSYNVVKISNGNSNTILDGFTIKGGNANGPSAPSNYAGGLYSSGGGPVLSNLNFSGNSGGYGAGVHAYVSNLTLTNVKFSGNAAATAGGGIYNSGSNLTLLYITFSNNSAPGGGGGMYNGNTSSATLTNVNFLGNSSSLGGGMSNYNSGTLKLTNVGFFGNAGTYGGGMRNYLTNPILTNVTFSENTAQYGGGIYNDGNANPTITNTTFSGNTASGNGGGMYSGDSSPTLTNITFSGNTAGGYGGGIFTTNGSPPLQNVTLSKNSAPNGGGLYYDVSNVKLRNVIVADSVAGGDCISSGTLGASYFFSNLIEDPNNACGLVHGVNGNIIGYDPSLGNLADNGGPTQTQALLVDSLAIDTGQDQSCPATDQRGQPRPAGNHCDMGAYESALTSLPRIISGNVGIGGVTLKYTDGTLKTVTSQLGGAYSLTVPVGWSGTVTPFLNPCFNFSPAVRPYNFVVANQTQQDYNRVVANCINVKIGNMTAGIYTFPSAGSSTRQSYNSISDGPVRVSNLSTKTFISSERIAYQDPQSQKWTSFSELMGLPLNLASTRYSFPFYNNTEIDTQVRIGNLDPLASTLVNVRIGSQYNQTFALNPNQSIRVNPKIKDGPVVIQSSGGVKIIASMRVAYQNPQSKKWTSFSEMMGMPDSQLSTSYLFPWFNNQELNSQLRIGNVGASRTGVQVWIGGVLRGAFYLDPNTYKRVAYPLNDGPVLIKSSSEKIVASASVSYTPDNGTTWTNVSEMMGFPISSLSTTYHFPWYNNDALNTQLRFGNVGNAPTTVTVTIGGQLRGSYNLLPNESTRASYLNLSSGPVVVQSSGNVPIIVSQRVAYLNTQTRKWTSYSEMMGMPASQLTNSYVFPWYNNIVLDTQIRYGVP